MNARMVNGIGIHGRYSLAAIFFFAMAVSVLQADTNCLDSMDSAKAFKVLDAQEWGEPAFDDSGTGDWRKHWYLDGFRAEVSNSPKGMYFAAGPVPFDDGCHAVLWTKDSFEGDIRVEYDYTRMDTVKQCVNILYIQATGLGTDEYPTDIMESADKRELPAMYQYFRYMNALHISYAAYGRKGSGEDYVRARRYPVAPDGNFDRDTVLPGDASGEGLFEPGVTYRITVIKRGEHLAMRVTQAEQGVDFTNVWNTSGFPAVTAGRVGLRHMWTRASRYANFKVWVHSN